MCTRTWTNVPCFLRFMLRNSSLQERVAEALDRSRRQPPATMVLGPYSFRIEHIEIKSCLDLNHLVHNDNITLSLIISHSFRILCFSMFCMIFFTARLEDSPYMYQFHRFECDSTERSHWVTEGGLLDFADPTCTLDLSHFKGLRLSTPKYRGYVGYVCPRSLSLDLLKESLSEEWKRWIENNE